LDGGSDGISWSGANPGNRVTPLPMSAPIASVDSDFAGSVPMDESLISPLIDASNWGEVRLHFDHFYRDEPLTNESANVQVRSSLTGGSWVTVLSFSGQDSGFPDSPTVDISLWGAGAPDLQIRFWYANANFSFYWLVDNVEVEGRSPVLGTCLQCLATPPADAYPDSPSPTFNWSAGGDTKWRVEFSSDPQFSTVDVTSKTSRKKWLGQNNWTPGGRKWGKILALAKDEYSLYFTVYWRAVGKTVGTIESHSFNISPALMALLQTPGNGASVPSGTAPTFMWDLNHNKKVQVEFSDQSDFATGVLVSSKKKTKKWIKGGEWIPGSGKWDKVVALGTTVYWRVRAIDNLGRETWSPSFSLGLVP